MTYKNFGRALTLLAGFGFVACGGSTTINFVGDPDSTGGEGGEGTGGSDGDGGSNLGGMGGGDGSGGSGGGSGGTGILGYCGDGTIDAASEDCDDGNERSRDGCSAACAVEVPFLCSGEPSTCTLFGNGIVDAGEQCDDGNTEDGDGCSSTGAVEGTCDDVWVLPLVDAGPGTRTAVVTANTAAGGASAPAQACSGLSLGGGNDRTYFVETTEESDLTVTVEADFDAILRIYASEDGSTCEQEREFVCIDDGGAGETEKFHYRRMPEDAQIVILVDGADEGEEGEFTLTVTQGCDADHVKLHRLVPFASGGDTEVLSMKNLSDYCTVNLDTVGLAVTDDLYVSPEAVDLPERGLAPGQVFRGSFDVIYNVNPNSYDFVEEPAAFDEIAAGAYLCDGPCDLTAGTNVTDALLTGNATNQQIPGTTFTPSQVVGADGTPYQAYVRVAYDGVAPDFLTSDWSPAFLVDPDDHVLEWFDEEDDASYEQLSLELPTFETDATEGTIVAFPPPAGSFAYSAYVAGVPTAVQNATYASYKVRTSAVDSYGCYTGLGFDNGSIGTSTGYNGLVAMSQGFKYFTSGVGGWFELSVQQIPGDTTQWHTAEFVNINWTNHTYDYYYDGALILEGAAMADAAATALTTFSVTPYYTVGCEYSDIIVRNGPPGRIWESPPVLVTAD